MKHSFIDVKKVIKVGNERIKYRNTEGNEAYIELAASANVWAHRHTELQSAKTRIVADKHIGDGMMCLEFYNIGHTKIGVKASPIRKLLGQGISQKQAQRFEELERQLAENGWGVYTV